MNSYKLIGETVEIDFSNWNPTKIERFLQTPKAISSSSAPAIWSVTKLVIDPQGAAVAARAGSGSGAHRRRA